MLRDGAAHAVIAPLSSNQHRAKRCTRAARAASLPRSLLVLARAAHTRAARSTLAPAAAGDFMSAVKKARVLCLHGYAQNAEFFRQRTGALRKGLKSVVEEFVFLDAPHPATAEFLGDVPEERGSALGWFNVGETSPGARPAISAQYVGVDAALERIRTAIQDQGPFDGILGFSQGATLAAYCCLHPEKAGIAAGGASPFRFAVIFSAFSPRDPIWSLEGGGDCALPTFHCFGSKDPSVPCTSSRAVAAHFRAPREHEHEGGHGVPSDAVLRNALKEFISTCMADAAPPTPRGGTAAAATTASGKAQRGAAAAVPGRKPARVAGGDSSHGGDQGSDEWSWRYMAWRLLRLCT